MLILVLKARSLHYLLTILLLVVSKNLRLLTFAIFAGQCKYQEDTLLYVEYILHPTGLYSQYSCIFRVYPDSTVQYSTVELRKRPAKIMRS